MSRAGKTEDGSHEYQIADGITACLMGDDRWSIFRRSDSGMLIDTGIDCKTLAACRRYARERSWKGSE